MFYILSLFLTVFELSDDDMMPKDVLDQGQPAQDNEEALEKYVEYAEYVSFYYIIFSVCNIIFCIFHI